MSTEFTKEFKTYDEQLRILAGRNLPSRNEGVCLRALKQIGYYRLSAYWYPFRIRDDDHVEGIDTPHEEVFPGLYLDDIVLIYEFDRKLRHILARALDRIELATRVAVAYQLGQHDRFAFEREDMFNDNCGSPSHWDPRVSQFEAFRRMVTSRQIESKEVFVQHYAQRYGGRLPVWVCIETWDFGTLNTCYQLLRPEDRLAIAASLGFVSARTLGSWLDPFRVLRNLCAHHSRLNRRHFASIQRFARNDRYSHIHSLNEHQKHRLYPILVAVLEFLRFLEAKDGFTKELRSLIEEIPSMPGLAERDFGFPHNWIEESVWK